MIIIYYLYQDSTFFPQSLGTPPYAKGHREDKERVHCRRVQPQDKAIFRGTRGRYSKPIGESSNGQLYSLKPAPLGFMTPRACPRFAILPIQPPFASTLIDLGELPPSEGGCEFNILVPAHRPSLGNFWRAVTVSSCRLFPLERGVSPCFASSVHVGVTVQLSACRELTP